VGWRIAGLTTCRKQIEPNNIRGARLRSKRILHLHAHKIAAFAHHNFRFERQLEQQCSAESCSRPRFANDKSASGPYLYDIVVAWFSCEDAWAKGSVPADIDTSEKNNQSHSQIMKKKTNRRYGSLRYLRIVEGRICGQPY